MHHRSIRCRRRRRQHRRIFHLDWFCFSFDAAIFAAKTFMHHIQWTIYIYIYIYAWPLVNNVCEQNFAGASFESDVELNGKSPIGMVGGGVSSNGQSKIFPSSCIFLSIAHFAFYTAFILKMDSLAIRR